MSFNLPTLEQVNQRISELVAVMDTTEKEIDVLERLKSIIKPRESTAEHYFVPSRTLGPGHNISYDRKENEAYCDCPAGSNGRECWAKRGVEHHAWMFKPGVNFDFWDEHGRSRDVTVR